MRTFESWEYPKAWTLGQTEGPLLDTITVWRRIVGPHNVEVRPGELLSRDIQNIRWHSWDGPERCGSIRILASDDSALMESAQRHVIADLHRQRVDINQHIEDAMTDLRDQLTPEEAVATTPSKTKP